MDRHAVKFAAGLSAVEVGLGSLLHGFHIPFRGNFLSLNQGFVLSRASFTGAEDRSRGISLTHTISLTAASLKSLSPAGKVLHPMLGISIQGFLFSLGQLLFGITWLGHSLGMVLVALWAIVHMFAVGWILNGNSFLEAIDWGIRKFSPDYGYPLVFGLIMVELLFGLVLVYFSKRMSTEEWERYEARLSAYGKKTATGGKNGKPRLFSPLTLLSVALTIVFLYFTQRPEARTIWIWLRPLGLMFLFAMFVHWVPMDRFIPYLKRRAPKLAENVEGVLLELRKS